MHNLKIEDSVTDANPPLEARSSVLHDMRMPLNQTMDYSEKLGEQVQVEGLQGRRVRMGEVQLHDTDWRSRGFREDFKAYGLDVAGRPNDAVAGEDDVICNLYVCVFAVRRKE